MHHDQGALGSASEHDAVYRQVSKLKEMGCNAIRGLIAYREKKIEEGRALYLEAIKDAKNIIEDPTYNWNAILNFIREEILATNIIPSDVVTVLSQIHETPKDKGVTALKQDILKLIAKERTASFYN